MMKKWIASTLVAPFAVLFLTLAGCPQSSETPPPGPALQENTPVQRGTTSVEGHVEPLVPAGQPTETKPADGPKKEGASLVPAAVYGKIAAEAVPMAPIEDLVGQIDEYVGKIGKNLEDLDGTVNYKSDADAIVRDASGLKLVALSVGMATVDSKYKKSAPALIQAASELAAVSTFEDAKKAYEALNAALTSEGDPSTLAWTKVAELPPVMKAVPNLSSTLTRLTNTEKKLKRQIEKEPARVFGSLAALAAIMQGSIANAKDTQKPDAADAWKKECENFRDMALKANAAAHDYADGKIDYDGYMAAFKAMTESCDHCHKEFYPSAVGKNE